VVSICVTSFVKQRCAVFEDLSMNKKEIIECIREINKSAKPEFLTSFSEEELRSYLDHLMEVDVEELSIAD
jgi:hypothetical protein